jgi:Tol biopolymer transport system component
VRSGDTLPGVSPDGKRIAFLRALPHTMALMVMAASGGEPVRVAQDFSVNYFAWASNSREIVFSSEEGSPSRLLYRVRLPDGQPAALPFLAPGVNATQLSASQTGMRLVYVLPLQRLHIWRFPLSRSGGMGAEVGKCVAESPARDMAPAYAPDGRRFAFASDRSGHFEVYVADRNGKDVLQLTFFGKGIAGSPRWSPDGRRIALDARPGEHAQIFVVDAEGGKPQPLTSVSDDSVMPEWSTDGRWVYYTRIYPNGGSDVRRRGAAGAPPPARGRPPARPASG